jgi:hypothetical protein
VFASTSFKKNKNGLEKKSGFFWKRYFNKTIEVFCNIKESPEKLTISGTANQ